MNALREAVRRVLRYGYLYFFRPTRFFREIAAIHGFNVLGELHSVFGRIVWDPVAAFAIGLAWLGWLEALTGLLQAPPTVFGVMPQDGLIIVVGAWALLVGILLSPWVELGLAGFLGLLLAALGFGMGVSSKITLLPGSDLRYLVPIAAILIGIHLIVGERLLTGLLLVSAGILGLAADTSQWKPLLTSPLGRLSLEELAVSLLAAFAWSGVAFAIGALRLPEWPLMWLLTAVLRRVSRQGAERAELAWRWCPVRWNEVIWLPLWDVAEILERLTRCNRAAGLEAISFVAAERPRQRRVAFRALERVMVSDLGAATLAEVASATERLSWILPDPLLSETAIARRAEAFLVVAQRVAQACELDSSGRRAAALAAALKELERIQFSLVAGPDELSRQLLKVAREWREVIVPAELEARTLALASDELPNPFIAGRPLGLGVEGESLFVGRRDLVRRAEQLLLAGAQPPTLLLQGPRRMGKSSILRQLPRLLGPDLVPVIVDCQDPAFSESLPGALCRISQRIAAVQPMTRDRVSPLERRELEGEPFLNFGVWLDRVESALPNGVRLLICMDEYERLVQLFERTGDDRLLDWLRHRLQHDPKFCLLFTGVRTFAEMGSAWTGRFLNAFRVSVGHLTREEATQLLTRPMEDFPLAYGGRSLEILLDATAGQPYLTQAVAFELVLHLNDDRRKTADDADAEAAIRNVFTSADSYFHNYWSDMGPDGQRVVHALARGEEAPELPRALRWLKEHLVVKDDYTFVTPLFERWVREYAPELEPEAAVLPSHPSVPRGPDPLAPLLPGLDAY